MQSRSLTFLYFLVFGLFVFSQPLRAEFISGIDLAKWCESKDPSDKAGCLSYILGVNDTLDRLSAGKKDKLYCLPTDNFASGELYGVVYNFMQKNPKYAHQSAAVNTMIALQRHYPCN